MKYILKVVLDPPKHYIHVSGIIEHAESRTFYLNENFTLVSALEDNGLSQCRMERDRPHPPFDLVSRPVIFSSDQRDLVFEYEGFIPEPIADINQLDEDIIELASYSGWYLKPGNLDLSFQFEVHLNIPQGYEVASNGTVENGTRITSQHAIDIVLFASNKVKRVVYERETKRLVFLCPDWMLPNIETRVNDILAAHGFFTAYYGSERDDDEAVELTNVFRPRGGWGYKRENATFLSAERCKDIVQYKEEFHELAHGWWGIADITTDDWINEGGAEFSAYAAAESIYGEEYAKQCVAEYIDSIKKATEKISIVATGPSSPDRYVNHYHKTAVMFINAQRKFGSERVFAVLKKVFQAYKGTSAATTAGFLSLCDEDMKDFFAEYLFAPGWDGIGYDVEQPTNAG